MKCVTPNSRPSAKTTTLVFGIPAVLLLLLPLIKFDPNKASSSLGALAHFVGRLFQAPDQKFLPTLFQLTGESLLIAFVAVMIAIAISFPISILAARNTAPHPVIGTLVRGIASIFRAIPDLILALLLASAIGLGNLPGVIALSVSGFGFLVKVYAESLEVVSRGPVEGLSACGADGFSVRWIGVVPQAIPDLVSYSLYQMDVNLRSAAILGAVGAGGIGYELSQAIKLFQFDRLGMIILVIYLCVTLLDLTSAFIRRRIM